MPPKNSAQKGVAHILLLISAIGLIAFLFVSNTATFKDTLFATLFPKPSSFASGEKLFGVNIAGGEFGEDNLPGTRGSTYIYPSSSNGYGRYQYFKNKGLTLVRVPFRWERVQRSFFGPLSSEDVADLKKVLDDANLQGQKVILDMHNYARYKNGNTVIMEMRRSDADKLADVWKKLAFEFKGHPALWGYEIMNEPNQLPEGDASWFDIAQATVNSIRTEDNTHFILVPGSSWQSADRWPQTSDSLKNIVDPADSNLNKIIFAAHQYFDADASGGDRNACVSTDVGVNRVNNFLNWLEANVASSGKNFRGILTEYGARSDGVCPQALDNFLNRIYAHPRIVGGTYWSAGPWWPADYGFLVEPINGTDRPQMSILAKYPSMAASDPVSTPVPSGGVSATSSMLLMGSNLGVWNMKSDGTVNENFVNRYALSTDPNDPTKQYTQSELAQGVIGVLRFPIRETGIITDAGLQEVHDAVINAGLQPLIHLESDNTEFDRMVTLVNTIFRRTIYFEFGNEDNFFSHAADTEFKNGWSGSIYGTRWKQLIPRLRQARSDMKIGGPVVSHLGNPGDLNQVDNKFVLDFFNSIKGQTNVYPDYISFHLYNEHGDSTDLTLDQILNDVSSPTNPNDWGDRIDWIRNMARQTLCYDAATNATQLCQNGIPVALTEWNWDARPENNNGRVDNRDLDVNFIRTYTYAVLDMLRAHNVFMAAQYGYGSDMGGNRLTMLSPWSAPEIKPQYYAFKDYVREKGLNSVSSSPTPISTPVTLPTSTPIGGSTISSLEAENMVLPTGSGQVFDDWNASGKKGLLIWSNAKATATVTTNSSNLVVRAKGDQCNGAPRMKVLVDGNQVYETLVSSTSYTDFDVPSVLSSGVHVIEVVFDNDANVSGVCDRNLRLDVLKFNVSLSPTATPVPTVAPTSGPLPTQPPVNSTPAPTVAPTPRPTATPVAVGDGIAPTVTLTSPQDGAVVAKNSRVTLSANASDNVGVSKVEFRVNNSVVSTDFQAPYTYDYKFSGKPNAVYTITATAIDGSNNSSSDVITVLTK